MEITNIERLKAAGCFLLDSGYFNHVFWAPCVAPKTVIPDSGSLHYAVASSTGTTTGCRWPGVLTSEVAGTLNTRNA